MKQTSKSLLKIIVVLLYTLIVSCNSEKGSPAPFDLTLSEGFSNPIGFYDESPVFSWKLPAGVQSQKAYAIVVASSPDLLLGKADLWNSGQIETDQTLFVKYEGRKFNSRQKVFWKVKYWDNAGNESKWSETAYFEMGLLNNGDWTAKWISLADEKAVDIAEINRKVHKVQYLRKDIEFKKSVKEARLYITAKGLYEASINGNKVGNDVLSPGFTVYEKRIETITYDVSSLLKKGNNVLGLELAEGWHSGRLIFRKNAKHSPQVMAQLEVKYKNGEVETFITDNSWKGTTEGPIRYSSLYDGEWYDANREIPGWNAPGFNDSEWLEVAEQAISPEAKLVPKRHYTTKTIMSLATQTISEPSKGNVVFDLGQNMVGVPKIKVPVKKGQKLQIRFAEMLDKNDEVYTKNYRSAVSKDFYIPAEDGVIEWQPKFTFHGFRYVELSGFDKNATPESSWVTGLVQHSDFDMSGIFESSHKKLNQLQSNIEWGLRGNFLDIPTDCPQRDERVGWTGDAQVFIPTSLFIADVHSFWASWMQSVRDEQRKDGSIPIIVPNVDVRGRSSSGWGDVATIIPWETFLRTGDKRILEDSYQTMMGWINYYRSQSQNHIVDMFTYGDWLQPFSEHPTDERKGETDEKLVNTAYYARSVDLTLKTATELELIEDVVMLESWLSEVRTAFQNHFFDADGFVSKGKPTQTAYLLAIGFNLLTPEMEEKAIPHLISEIEKADFHLRTGFLGTPLLAPVLEKIGRTDIMFEMLFKETYPSWFYSINQGATTMWERWNSYTHEAGFHPGGMNSFNHYAYGAVGQFMYERIAGISPMEPGYKKIRIAPRPGGPITSAKGEYDSPYGKIKSQWELKNNEFKLKVTIPPNTTAHVVIPVMGNNRIVVDNKKINERKDIEFVCKDDNYITMKIITGSYQITSR